MKYAIDHCLFFPFPEKDAGTLLLSGWCIAHQSENSITVDVSEGGKRIASFSPGQDGRDGAADYDRTPMRRDFKVYLQMNRQQDTGGDIELEFKSEGETCLKVSQKATDIHDYIHTNMDDLGLSEIGKCKLVNLLLNETERVHHVKGIKSSPIYLLINPSWTCNLECPYCHANIKRKHGYSMKNMDSNTLQKIMDRFAEKMIMAHLTNWGEPFLYERTTEYIRVMKQHEIYVSCCSNLNIQYKDKDIEDIVSSGLDRIVACLDGATQETYVKYRRGGSLALALDNIQKIIKKRQDYGRETPRIWWRYLCFDWNEGEVEPARQLSNEIGCDEFEVKNGDVFESYTPSLGLRDYSFMDSMTSYIRERMIMYGRERSAKNQYFGCDHLYHQIAINADGSVHPCCHVHETKHLFGSIHSKVDIFNSALYTNARRLFSKLPPEDCLGYDPCLNCWIVTDAQHKGHVPSAFDFFSAYECLTGRPLGV